MAKYQIRDDRGLLLREVPGVLAPVNLTSVATTSGSNILTVDATAGLYPGMAIFAPNVPLGAFVHSIPSDTTIEMWASAFNASTGVWTTSAANANATANASGGLAQAHGFNPVPVTRWYAKGVWRNIHSTTSHGSAGTGVIGATISEGSASYARQGFGAGMALLPTAGTISSGTHVATAFDYITSDHLKAIPLKRHDGQPWGVWILVSTGGYQTQQPAHEKHSCGYAGADD